MYISEDVLLNRTHAFFVTINEARDTKLTAPNRCYGGLGVGERAGERVGGYEKQSNKSLQN